MAAVPNAEGAPKADEGEDVEPKADVDGAFELLANAPKPPLPVEAPNVLAGFPKALVCPKPDVLPDWPPKPLDPPVG